MTGSDIKKCMIEARDEYIDIIKRELLGPGSELLVEDKETELISSSPTSRYSIGILYPQGLSMEQDNDEVSSLEDETGEGEKEVLSEVNNSELKDVENNKNYIYDETADENLDEEINMSNQYKPSSMGITFFSKGDSNIIKGKIKFGTYNRAMLSECVVPFEVDEEYSIPQELDHIIKYNKNKKQLQLLKTIKAKDVKEIFERDTIPENEADKFRYIMYKLVDLGTKGYKRSPHEVEFKLDFGNKDYAEYDLEIDSKDIEVRVVGLRRKVDDKKCSITVMVVNENRENLIKPEKCLFQLCLEVNSEDNSFIFDEIKLESDFSTMDEEELSLDMLYRNKKNYATGMGTSADWDIDENGNGIIRTDFFPVVEIPPMDFSLPENNKIGTHELSMKYLSDLDETDKDIKLASLKSLVDLYQDWIINLKEIAQKLDSKHVSSATKNIQSCQVTCDRMYAGIEILRNNQYAYDSFQLSNRAMFMQRVHIAKQNELSKESVDRYQDDVDIAAWLKELDYYECDDSNCRWRPFQLAFILMDIVSIIDETSDDRNIVDLIWFPTGGGKTEAYLGLTAFTIFYRKLQYPTSSKGTAVIMRYTLRLLATQQFTRAATLICACEFIRQDCENRRRHRYPIYLLGKDPITIGLWIGDNHTPNKNGKALEFLDKLRDASSNSIRNEKDRNNKFQVLKCPWCGTKMVKDGKKDKLVGEWGYAMKNKKHFYMFCPHNECEFRTRLPIQIIDEELYNNPPTLLFGTVDKFAMLPWDGRIGNFFNVGNKNRAPELIIQDELHLISGSLGTIVGLYETAIDGLCSLKGVSPKIVASTATIRRASEQCSTLYNRDVIQFPAPGIDAEDSFFAKESKIDYANGIYGRKYVGYMPSGKTKAMMEVRAIAAMLQKIYTMDLPDCVKDKMWTLTAYFNSLKDLGKASTLVEDDVKDFIVRTANRMRSSRRLIVGVDELTSRVSTTELNETLDKLEKVEYSRENIKNKKYASNILLATNMISVGIDVARLNVMLMIGQPKLTSEYIQASSRVGRSYPGIVYVQYDGTKSRDRSHYEQFKAYHDAFYSYVEPTGATPFSKPARDRALHAVLVSLTRYMNEFCKDDSASEFDMDYLKDDISQITKYVIERVKGINERNQNQAQENIEDIRNEIESFYEEWQQLVDDCNENSEKLYFGRKFMVVPPGNGQRRLLKQYNAKGKDSAIETLTSMRNVDEAVKGSIVIWEDRNAR